MNNKYLRTFHPGHSGTSLLLGSLAILVGVMPARPSWGQASADSHFFEIDGDYGSVISYVNDDLTMDVTDGTTPYRLSSRGRREEINSCYNWTHASVSRSIPRYPYMGAWMYQVECRATSPVRRRNEQYVVEDWFAGSDSERSFAFAFMFTEPIPVGSRTFVSQWHQAVPHPPPVRIHWSNVNGSNVLEAGVRFDYFDASRKLAGGYVSLGEMTVVPGAWYYFRVRINPGPEGNVDIWRMDNQTGTFLPFGSYTGKVGFEWEWPDGRTLYQPGYGSPSATRLSGGNLDWTWKIGHYANDEDAILLYYDNIAYGKRWNDVTKNRLIGYQKSVLRLQFEESSGATVNDTSWMWNEGSAGDPLTDYNNDGEIQGFVSRNQTGVSGRSLRLSGSNFVSVPIDRTDFDFGNYVTVSAWFRTTSHPADNKGLVMIDEYSTSWKTLLYVSDTLLGFGVRHPGGDGTGYSKANYTFPAGTYSDGEWHHAVGTFNRFAPDNQRVKLYIDGQRVKQVAGLDQPVALGSSRLTVGKFSVEGYFLGDIDDVNVFQFAMTDGDVWSLWLQRGAP